MFTSTKQRECCGAPTTGSARQVAAKGGIISRTDPAGLFFDFCIGFFRLADNLGKSGTAGPGLACDGQTKSAQGIKPATDRFAPTRKDFQHRRGWSCCHSTGSDGHSITGMTARHPPFGEGRYDQETNIKPGKIAGKDSGRQLAVR